MARPKTKGEPLSFRLSIEAYEELCRRASKVGVSPTEHLIASLEKTLGRHGAAPELRPWTDAERVELKARMERDPRHEVTDTFRPDDFERNEVTVKMEPPPQFTGPVDPSHITVPRGGISYLPKSDDQIPEPTVTAHEDGTVIAWATGGSEDSSESKFGKHPSWRLNSIGVNICTACGMTKTIAGPECEGNPL